MRYALERVVPSSWRMHIEAVDINVMANTVYAHNFSERPHTLDVEKVGRWARSKTNRLSDAQYQLYPLRVLSPAHGGVRVGVKRFSVSPPHLALHCCWTLFQSLKIRPSPLHSMHN